MAKYLKNIFFKYLNVFPSSSHDQTHPKACPTCKKLFASVLWLIRQK